MQWTGQIGKAELIEVEIDRHAIIYSAAARFPSRPTVILLLYSFNRPSRSGLGMEAVDRFL